MNFKWQFIQNYIDNFTFNADKISFTSEKAQLKDLRPSNAIFYTSFEGTGAGSLDAQWSRGTASLTGSAGGNAAVIATAKFGTYGIDLDDAAANYVDYNVDCLIQEDYQLGNIGCIGFWWRLGAAPADDVNLIEITNTSGNANQILIKYDLSDNLLVVSFKDDEGSPITFSGTEITDYNFNRDATDDALWGASGAYSYNEWIYIELNWNLNTGGSGVIDLFVDGKGDYSGQSNYASIQTSTGIRDVEAINRFRIGDGTNDAKSILDEIIIYNAVQNTEDFAPAVEAINQQIYNETNTIDNPSIEPSQDIHTSSITAFDASIEASGSDTVKFSVLLDGVEYWYDTGWTTTGAGSYAATNTIAEINAQISGLNTLIGAGAKVSLKAYIHTNDGSTTPSLLYTSADYTFIGLMEDFPYLIPCFGRCWNTDGTAQINVKIEAYIIEAKSGTKINKPFFNLDGHLIKPITQTVFTDTDGKFTIDCLPITDINSEYKMKFVFSGHDFYGEATEEIKSSMTKVIVNTTI